MKNMLIDRKYYATVFDFTPEERYIWAIWYYFTSRRNLICDIEINKKILNLDKKTISDLLDIYKHGGHIEWLQNTKACSLGMSLKFGDFIMTYPIFSQYNYGRFCKLPYTFNIKYFSKFEDDILDILVDAFKDIIPNMHSENNEYLANGFLCVLRNKGKTIDDKVKLRCRFFSAIINYTKPNSSSQYDLLRYMYPEFLYPYVASNLLCSSSN